MFLRSLFERPCIVSTPNVETRRKAQPVITYLYVPHLFPALEFPSFVSSLLKSPPDAAGDGVMRPPLSCLLLSQQISLGRPPLARPAGYTLGGGGGGVQRTSESRKAGRVCMGSHHGNQLPVGRRQEHFPISFFLLGSRSSSDLGVFCCLERTHKRCVTV